VLSLALLGSVLSQFLSGLQEASGPGDCRIPDGRLKNVWTDDFTRNKTRDAKKLPDLSGLGHFLKGSSATLGFNKIRDSCQIIQQYGNHMNVDGSPEPDDEVCLKRIAEALAVAEADTAELEKVMRQFFNPPE
jgi:HPt (histidine-containing phosphotransfer) domain-containing protein